MVSLAMAGRVGELQSVSAEVSSSGDDMFLTYLPEFREQSQSLLALCLVLSPFALLWDFVRDLPEELLLCPVRALRLYLSCTVSLPSSPHTLFVSPRAPTRPLSKNTHSFFIRYVIAEAYSSAGVSLPSVSLPSSSSSSSSFSSSSSRPRFSLRAHGVRAVATSWAFQRNAPLASVLEAASWSSAAVFTSFYLTDVQFSSSHGFCLGPVVATGSVV